MDRPGTPGRDRIVPALMTLLWVVPLGLLVGIALGSLGGGGSILTVPAWV